MFSPIHAEPLLRSCRRSGMRWAKPVQIQLQHKLFKSVCPRSFPDRTILACGHRTLECQHYQGRAPRRAIGHPAFPAISVENAVEITEFCGNRWKKYRPMRCTHPKSVTGTPFRSMLGLFLLGLPLAFLHILGLREPFEFHLPGAAGGGPLVLGGNVFRQRSP